MRQTAGSGGTAAAEPRETPAAAGGAWPARVGGALSGAAGTVAGVLPHVLHHIAPIAGAALLAGAAGTALFGALGLALMAPMLLRIRRRAGARAAAAALTVFAAMFAISTLWIGPAIRGDGGGATIPGGLPVDHSSHH